MRKEDMTEWLKLGEVLDRLRVNQNTIDRWIRNGTFPKPHYFGLTRRWSVQEVEDWCQNTPTDSRDVPHKRRRTVADGRGKTCDVCGTTFQGRADAKTCSATCRKKRSRFDRPTPLNVTKP